MLCLSRKKSERILITSPEGTVITLVVVDIRGDKVRIGLDAPREWMIHREEVHRAILRGENKHDRNA